MANRFLRTVLSLLVLSWAAFAEQKPSSLRLQYQPELLHSVQRQYRIGIQLLWWTGSQHPDPGPRDPGSGHNAFIGHFQQ